jgi:hypothetical protein
MLHTFFANDINAYCLSILFSLSLLNYDRVHSNCVWSWPWVMRKSKGTGAGDTGTQGTLSLFITFLYSYCQASIFLQFSPFPHPRLKKLVLPAFQYIPATQTCLACTHHPNAPSPTNAMPRPPSCVVGDDYDEGITESLLTLSHYRFASFIVTRVSTTPRHRNPPLPPN